MWNKALNQAKVEASFALRRVESVYNPSAICALGFASSKANTASKVAEIGKDSPAKALLSLDSHSKVAKQPKVVEKETDTTKGVAPDSTKPAATPQDPPKEKEVPSKMEIVPTTLLVLAKEVFKGKGPESLKATLTQTKL